MRSRREQLQAHRFVTRRIVSAVLIGEPDSPEQPTRRFGLAAFASVMVAAIVVAGFAVYGLLRPAGSTAWEKENALVIEKETGARFVYSGGRLHPVVNYASALLIVGGTAGGPVTVSSASLDGVPRDVPHGIPGAPDAIPAPAALVGLPWQVCSYPSTTGAAPVRALVLGGRPPESAQALGDRGLLVTDSQRKYLLWDGRRLRLPGAADEAALGYAGSAALDVAPSFLDAVPAGHDLAVAVPGVGDAVPGHHIQGRVRKVGELFSVQRAGGGTDYYVLLASGLAKLSAVAYALIRVAPEIQSRYGSQPPVTPIAPGDVGVTVQPDLAGLPDTPPRLAAPTGDDPALCVERGAGSSVVRFSASAPKMLAEARTGSGSTGDAVQVPGGHGALVRAPGSAVFLVTDAGRRFAVPTDEAKAALGYKDVRPLEVSSELIALIPQGPALDVGAARLPAAR